MSEADYYQAVEEFFVEKRGDPLFLSNADWVLVHAWRCEGIPLRVVLRGIADSFEAKALSWSRERKVSSLRYCRQEVEAARDRWQHAVGGGNGDGGGPGERLLALAESLAGAAPPNGPAAALTSQTALELRRWAAEGHDRREVQRLLQEREGALVAALAADAGAAALERHRAEIEGDLAPDRDRMPQRVLEQIRGEAFARRLLGAHGLPRLSLLG